MWSIYSIFLLTLVSSFETISGGVVGCYYESWAVYNKGHAKASVSNIDPNLCTHVFYAFAGLNEKTHTIESLDAWNDLPDDGGLANYININKLKEKNSKLKVLLSIGGSSEGSEKYSKMVNNKSWRGKFVKSVEKFLQKYKFDGLDVDWEYPTRSGGQKSDRSAFVSLLSELKSRFKQHGWILTGAFGADTDLLNSGYDVQNIAKHIDFFNLMTYDYHGLWDKKTSANSPLSGSPSIEETVKAWLKAGAPAKKIVLGIPFYGLTYILKNQRERRMGAPAESYSFPGIWSKSEGSMGYNEICNEFKNGGWSQDYDSDSETAFATNGKNFISFDIAKSIKAKVWYAMKKGFAGAMAWSVDTDDLYNDCGNGANSLLHALHNAVNGN